MLLAFNKKHSDRNTGMCLRHASQPNGDARSLCDGWEKTLWIHWKLVGFQSPNTVCRFFGTTSIFLKQQRSRARLPDHSPWGQQLLPACRAPGQHHQAQPATGHGPTNSRCLFFLKALFLRLQKTQPQKSIRAIKKRHKLASSDGFERLKPTPRLTFLFCPVLLSSKVLPTLSPTNWEPPRHPTKVHRAGQSQRKLSV